MQLTATLLKKLYPSATMANINKHLPYINEAMARFEINTALRVSAFLAVIANETGYLKWVKELGNDAYFQKYEPTTKVGKDLGNTQKGDGAKYKGRGAIQLTGRGNYTAATKYFGVDFVNSPALVEDLKYAWLVSGWFWKVARTRKGETLNSAADRGDLMTIQIRVNGGPTNGWDVRKASYDHILPILTAIEKGEPIPEDVPTATVDAEKKKIG